MASSENGFARRWRLLYSQLNGLVLQEEREEREERLEGYWIAPQVPARLVIRPRPGAVELGPPCRVCGIPLARTRVLVACTACLELSHRSCLPQGEACAQPRCCRERALGASA